MGSSAIGLKDVFFWSNDGILRLWAAFLVREIDHLVVAPEWLREARTSWYEEAMTVKVGFQSLDLDRYIVTAEHKAMILQIAHAALENIGELGDWIEVPPVRLPAVDVDNDPTWARGGLPVTSLMHVGAAFIVLLRHVPVEPEQPTFADAVMYEWIAKTAGARARPQRGHINVGKAQLALSSGQVYRVEVTAVQLFDGRTMGGISPSKCRGIIAHLVGVAPDARVPGAVLIQEA